eukprot:6573018-Pyramimonas_sp.AAC.1
MVVIHELPDGNTFSYQGWWSADLASSCRTTTYADLASSTESEYIGILWACVYLLSHPSSVPALIRTDSLNAVRASSGLSAPPISDRIGRLACAYWAQLEATREVSIDHVKGHVGHPWNTLADWVAGAIVSGNLSATDFPEDLVQRTLYSRPI